MPRFRRALPIRALPVIALLALVLGGCLERAQPKLADQPRPVQVTRVQLVPASETRVYAGRIMPRHSADLGFRAGGRIIERMVDAGARVTAGQVLARLDPTDLELARRAAEAELTSTEAIATQAVADSGRSTVLARQGNVSAAADDLKQALARTTRQRVETARANLQLARNRLAYAELRAPQDGVVTATMADPGTVVAEGAPVLRLADAAGYEAEIALPETALPGLASASAEVGFWARADVRVAATLREVSPQADPQLRTYSARFVLTDPPAWIALGMSATVELSTTHAMKPGAQGRVAELPAAALGDRGAGPMVWTVDAASGRLSARGVTVLRLGEGKVRVSGLEDGTLVVSAGVQKLDPALRVRVTDIRPPGV